MYKCLLPFCLLFVLPLCSLANGVAKVDSLLRAYDAAGGTARMVVGRQLLAICAEKAVFFGNEPPQMTEGMTAGERDLTVWFSVERYYTTNAYYAEALSIGEKAREGVKSERGENEERDLDDMEATLLCDRAYCLFKTSDYTAAIEAGQEAKHLSQRTKNWMQLSRAYLYLALVNHALRNYDEAKVQVEKSIETNARLGVNMQTHNVLGCACEIYCSARELDRAVEYGRQAVEAARAMNYLPGVANHLTQLSYAYDRAGEYARGIAAADSAIAIVMANEPIDRNQLAISLEFKGWNLIDIGRHREAAEVLRRAIALEMEVGNTHAAMYDYRTLSEALEPDDPHAALAAIRRYTQLSDSLHSEQLKELMSRADAELHNDELQEANEQSRRMNRIVVTTSLVFTLLLVALAASLWWAFRQKRRTAEALQRLTVARESFFTHVTHEFRTPLTVILGIAKEEKNEVLERQALQLLDLVNQLLDISKVKSAIGEQPQTRDNVAAYVGMVVESCREMARQKGVEVAFESDEGGIETSFVADYWQKMVSNLLSNAIKFTPEGGTVCVSLHRHNEQLELTVADTGCGIAAKDLPHIFDPFYRADDSAVPGSGIGLALVRQIVDAIGAKVEVKSRVGEGTSITVKWNPATSSSLQGGLPKGVGGSVVLIVEDNRDVANLIGRQLSDHYDIHFAADGEEGIEQARQLVPDLIITDLMMPHTDGLALCRAIREDDVTNHIPIIVITAKITEDDRIRGLKAGADAYLTKPFNAEVLKIRVEKLLEQRKMLYEKWGKDASVAPTVAVASTAFLASSEQFIEKMRQVVLQLMPQGECDVERVASEMCMSSSQLRRKLNAVTGQSPKKYIQEIQLEKACQLLQNPERTLAEVAESCGFYDLSHFVRVFRQTYGVTPSNYMSQSN